MEDRLVYTCALATLFEFRPVVARAIMSEFDNLKDFFDLPFAEIDNLLRGNKHLTQVLKSGNLLERAHEDIAWCLSKGVEIISIEDEQRYPRLLSEIADAPILLYYNGNSKLNNSYTLSVVGTRLASNYGKQMCVKLLEDLCSMGYKPVVTSGLAYGIDSYAHRAALDLGLETIAVLPNGIDKIYPSNHRDLAKKIVKQGAVITEFPRESNPLRVNFIRRNRIIAAMSQAVILVESRVKGGSMLTVEYANNYSREVFAVPGRITDINSFGCNYLISKNIAHICNNAQKIIDVLRWNNNVSGSKILKEVEAQPNLFSFDSQGKNAILLALNCKSPVNIDYICSSCGLDFEQVSGLLLELELEGKVKGVGWDGYIKF